MLEWSIVAAVSAWLIVSILLVIAIIQGIRLMRQTARTLKSLDDQAAVLMKQTTDLTARADHVMSRAQEAADEILKWREASEQTRSVVQGWCETADQISRRTLASMEAVQRNNEQRIRDTLQWVDFGYTLWHDMKSRHKRAQG